MTTARGELARHAVTGHHLDMTNATNACNTVTLSPLYTHAVRVSSAQAKGAAKKYAYWGAAEYRAVQRKDGVWTWRCVMRARSDRRSHDRALSDAESRRDALSAQGWHVCPDEVGVGESVDLVDIDACTAVAGAARCV